MRITTTLKRRTGHTALGILLFAFAGWAHAAVSTQGTCSISGSSMDATGMTVSRFSATCPQNLSQTMTSVRSDGESAAGDALVSAIGSFNATAAYGKLAAATKVSQHSGRPPGGGGESGGAASASASFSDSLVLLPDLGSPASFATVRFSGVIDGRVVPHGPNVSLGLNSTISFSGAFSSQLTFALHNPYEDVGYLNIPGEAMARGCADWTSCLLDYSFDIDVPVNTRFSVLATYSASAGTYSFFDGATFAATAGNSDFGLTLNMDVLTTDVTLSSLSGHDYSSAAPIPEPSTWALMAVGLLGIGASSARRRKAAALNAAA